MICYWWLKKELEVEFAKQYIGMLKQIIDIWKTTIKNIESSYLMYLDASKIYGWAMSRKFPVNGFKWVKNWSKFNEIFIKHYAENSDKGYFLKVHVDYPKTLFDLHKDLPFLPERKKVNKVEKLICNIEDIKS